MSDVSGIPLESRKDSFAASTPRVPLNTGGSQPVPPPSLPHDSLPTPADAKKPPAKQGKPRSRPTLDPLTKPEQTPLEKPQRRKRRKRRSGWGTGHRFSSTTTTTDDETPETPEEAEQRRQRRARSKRRILTILIITGVFVAILFPTVTALLIAYFLHVL